MDQEIKGCKERRPEVVTTGREYRYWHIYIAYIYAITGTSWHTRMDVSTDDSQVICTDTRKAAFLKRIGSRIVSPAGGLHKTDEHVSELWY